MPMVTVLSSARAPLAARATASAAPNIQSLGINLLLPLGIVLADFRFVVWGTLASRLLKRKRDLGLMSRQPSRSQSAASAAFVRDHSGSRRRPEVRERALPT